MDYLELLMQKTMLNILQLVFSNNIIMEAEKVYERIIDKL